MLMNIDMHIVPVENEISVANKTNCERLTAPAAVNATNRTNPQIQKSGQTWRWML